MSESTNFAEIRCRSCAGRVRVRSTVTQSVTVGPVDQAKVELATAVVKVQYVECTACGRAAKRVLSLQTEFV